VLERFVNSKVSDASAGSEIDTVRLWKEVGGKFHNLLRVSDELDWILV